ncbi:MAG TPA: alpha/beta hydrolase [Thermoleophilaceae bacterium]
MSADMPHVEGVTHNWTEVNGFRMHYAEAGPADAEPIVMLHGWPQHWYEWRHQIPRLAGTNRVICPDLRGLGWSEAPASGYDKSQLADDVLMLLATLGIPRFKLVGHDWGGWVGFLMCLKAPQRIDKYVALNIVHPFQKPDVNFLTYLPRTWYQWVIEVPGGDAILRNTNFVEWAMRLGFADKSAISDADIDVFASRVKTRDGARASQQYYRTFTLKEMPQQIRQRPFDRERLKVPTRLVFGTKDIFIPTSLLRGYEDHADDMLVEYVPDAGHFIADEKPDLVTDRIESFFGLRKPTQVESAT